MTTFSSQLSMLSFSYLAHDKRLSHDENRCSHVLDISCDHLNTQKVRLYTEVLELSQVIKHNCRLVRLGRLE